MIRERCRSYESGEEKIKRIRLSDHFNYGKLIRFVLPSVVMMIFTSIYSVVDGLFVSNFVGKAPFAALNLIFPLLMIIGSIGFMLGAGGSAIVSKTLGEGDRNRANKCFSLLIYTAVILGIFLSAIGIIFIRPVAVFLGADSDMLEYCVMYGRIILMAMPAFMLQNMFQSFFITAEKPHLGLAMTIIAGVTNMILDALLVAVLKLGLAGAAYATAISQCIGGFAPLIYFFRKNSSLLRLTKTKFELSVLLKASSNGVSELLSNISASIVTMLYNYQLMSIAGENGIAAYGVIMYVQFVFSAIFIGYAIGSAPIIGYHYGADNADELSSILKKSLKITGICGACLAVLALVLSAPLSNLFVGYDEALFNMTVRGFKMYAFSFLLCGFNIFGSSFFTALSNGLVSAAISFLRTVVFQVAAVIILPIFLGIDGIWLAISVAEILSLIITLSFIVKKKRVYGY